MWSQSIVTPKYLCYKKEELLRQNIFFITQPRDGNHVALSPNLKVLVFPAPFFNAVGVQAPTALNAPRGCARIRTGICLLKQTRIRRARLASESWLRIASLQIATESSPIPAPDLDAVYISEECAESVYRLHTKYKYTKTPKMQINTGFHGIKEVV